MEKLIPVLNDTFLVRKDTCLSDLVLTFTWENQTKSYTHPTQEHVVLVLKSPLLWQKFDPMEWQEVLQITVCNIAVSGDGKVCCQIGPGELTAPAALYLRADKDAEIGELDDEDAIVDEENISLGRLAGWRCNGGSETVLVNHRWSIEVQDGDPPIKLSLGLTSAVLEEMDRKQVETNAVFPVSYEIWRNGACVITGAFELSITFTLEKYLGPEYLAIDFGTSAIAMAFAEDLNDLLLRDGELAPSALINLQHLYKEIYKDDKQIQDMETGSPFLSNFCLLFPGENIRLGTPDFVRLPMHPGAVGESWDLVIPYLKMLIGAGYTEVPLQEPIKYCNWDGQEEHGRPSLEGTMQSAFKALERDYIGPYLRDSGNQSKWDKLVVAHPNTFTLTHIEVLERIVKRSFPDKDPIIFISESDAVAIYYLFREFELRGKRGQAVPRQQHILTYDIGAGTLDLTYLYVEREDGSHVPQRIAYKAKVGIPIAGNHLDILLARLAHGKLQAIEETAKAHGIEFEYRRKIVGVGTGLRAREMYDFWTHILQFKREYAMNSAADAVPLNLGPVGLGAMISPSQLDRESTFYDEHGVMFGQDEQGRDCYFLNIRRQEIEAAPGIRRWLEFLTEDAVETVLSSVVAGTGKAPVDVVVITGRTAMWPGLRERLIAKLESRVTKPDALFIPQLGAQEAKQAVVLGASVYARLWKDEIQFDDRNIWGRYGVVYEPQRGKREFKDLFPLDLAGVKSTRQGNRVLYLPQGEVSIDIANSDKVSIVCSIAADPAKVLKHSDEDRVYSEALMIPIMQVHRDFFSQARTMTVSAKVDEENRLHLEFGPDRGGKFEPSPQNIRSKDMPLAWPIRPMVLPPDHC